MVPSMQVLDGMRLGLSGDLAIRKINASLAIAAVNAFLVSPRVPQAFFPYIEQQEAEFVNSLREDQPSHSADIHLARPYPGTYEQILAIAMSSAGLLIVYPYLLALYAYLPVHRLPTSLAFSCRLAGIGFDLNLLWTHIALLLTFVMGNFLFPLLFRPSKRIPQTVVQESLPQSAIAPCSLPEAYVRGLA